MQLGLALFDEKEELKEKGELPGGLNSNQGAALEKINKDYGKSDLSSGKMGNSLLIYSHNGWREAGCLREKKYNFVRTFLKKKISDLGFGCCARSCGCCKKPRETHHGRRSDVLKYRPTHCTIEYGCCILWRGFHYLRTLQ